ncbi:MAG: hypothetical protein L3J97_02295 [Thermoplasmata archaeon]|nr:hypothetical protein [Thermoplasmata archaeon]
MSAAYRPGTTRSVYYKWQGIHWVLASLADLGYPQGDRELIPLLNRAAGLWLSPGYFRGLRVTNREQIQGRRGVPIIRGRARRCASQQGNALRYLSTLAWPDQRCSELAALLLRWQWPDGGWNCDLRPDADSSSFMESLTPMRGLAAYAAASQDSKARRAAMRASELFLQRRLFRRKSDGKVMSPDFLKLHYPVYWHYDLLGGLKGIAELGCIRDPRCTEALDWLEARELPGGGWPAERRYYRVSRTFRSSSEFVDWGPTGSRTPNEWVTTDALHVLKESGRLTV